MMHLQPTNDKWRPDRCKFMLTHACWSGHLELSLHLSCQIGLDRTINRPQMQLHISPPLRELDFCDETRQRLTKWNESKSNDKYNIR